MLESYAASGAVVVSPSGKAGRAQVLSRWFARHLVNRARSLTATRHAATS